MITQCAMDKKIPENLDMRGALEVKNEVCLSFRHTSFCIIQHFEKQVYTFLKKMLELFCSKETVMG